MASIEGDTSPVEDLHLEYQRLLDDHLGLAERLDGFPRSIFSGRVRPTDGMAGFLWGDFMGKLHKHQGIDIFAGTDVGITRVISAYPGYLTRLPDWKSSVIVRVPSDPLNPGKQIWLYYTHMADNEGNSFISSEFPAGISEKYIEAGTLLGYQGNYSGDPGNPVGVHLHFSIVEDDGNGQFKNELEIDNTLDPSPYLGLLLNGYENRDNVPMCEK